MGERLSSPVGGLGKGPNDFGLMQGNSVQLTFYGKI